VARVTLVAFLTLLTASVVAQQQTQQPTPQPTFRTGANYVRVDMYASKDGKPIEDLKQDEVEILEDGKPQTIDSFEHVKVRTLIPEELRKEPTSVTESRQMAADPRARIFVIFLDTYHTQVEGSGNIRQPLTKFLERVLGADDMVAVMTPEMGASDIAFSRKADIISKMLQREWYWGRRERIADDDEREDLYKSCYGLDSAVAKELKDRRREKLTLDALEDLMIHLAGVREERKAILTFTEGWRLYTKNTELAQSNTNDRVRPGDVLFRPPVAPPSDRGNLSSSLKVQCEADRMALALMDDEQRLRDLTQIANRGNVTFYPVYARGLVAFDSPIGPDYPPDIITDAKILKARQDSMRFLADETDGTAIINTNNIAGMLQRIADDLSSYYLMGYYATNTKTDGRYRSISVRLKRPGIMVRARKGYRAFTADEVERGAAASTPKSAAAASVASALTPVVSVSARAQFRIRAASWAHASGSASEGAMWVVGELDSQTRRLPAWSRGAQADVAVIAPNGQQVASQKLDLKPGESAFSLQVPESGGVAPGDYTVRVRLRSPVEGELGLSDTTRVAVKASNSLGEAVLWRRGASTGPQYVRTADPRFQRSDRLRLEMATSSSEAVTARLIDRNGSVMTVQPQISERPDPSGQFKWIVIDLTLAPFAAGDYAVDASQGEAKQLTAFRIVP
jgi:VWFA-related protein